MRTTVEYLDAVKARAGITSDYALAPKLGITRSAVSRLRQKKDFFGDSTAVRVAELLETDPAAVMVAAHLERAKDDAERAAWESILKRLGGAAAALCLGLALSGAPAPTEAASEHNCSQPANYATYSSYPEGQGPA